MASPTKAPSPSSLLPVPGYLQNPLIQEILQEINDAPNAVSPADPQAEPGSPIRPAGPSAVARFNRGPPPPPPHPSPAQEARMSRLHQQSMAAQSHSTPPATSLSHVHLGSRGSPPVPLHYPDPTSPMTWGPGPNAISAPSQASFPPTILGPEHGLPTPQAPLPGLHLQNTSPAAAFVSRSAASAAALSRDPRFLALLGAQRQGPGGGAGLYPPLLNLSGVPPTNQAQAYPPPPPPPPPPQDPLEALRGLARPRTHAPFPGQSYPSLHGFPGSPESAPSPRSAAPPAPNLNDILADLAASVRSFPSNGALGPADIELILKELSLVEKMLLDNDSAAAAPAAAAAAAAPAAMLGPGPGPCAAVYNMYTAQSAPSPARSLPNYFFEPAPPAPLFDPRLDLNSHLVLGFGQLGRRGPAGGAQMYTPTFMPGDVQMAQESLALQQMLHGR